MIAFPNAKINIGLFVTERREDGFHNLETVFYPVKAEDVLEILPATDTKVQLSGLPVSGDETANLAWRAWSLLQQLYPDQVKPVQIILHKAIPMGAGMGGGSSDGAFMLRMLNAFFALQLSEELLMEYALQLGSDCPFFISNRPCFAMGRGEVLEPLALDLSNYTFQVICPEIHVSTADAFRNIQPEPASFNLKNIGTLAIDEWRHHIFNDFEKTVFRQHPALADVKEQLYDGGALYASMSGTGSSVYGIFPKDLQAPVDMKVPFREFVY